jgi:membrane protease subunit HflC
MYKHLPTIALALLIVISTSSSAFYIVPEGQQAIITQFGRPIGLPESSAGLKVKLPYVQEVRFLDKRILNWDGKPNQIPTKDKKYIYVDTTARWRIADPLLFIKTVQTERNALSRIDSIMEDATRDSISGNNLVEAVRNTNSILEGIEKAAAARKAAESTVTDPDAIEEMEGEVSGEMERVHIGREKLSAMITEKAATNLKGLGIELIDVQLRRIAYEDSVEKKVYERMISERQRIAEKIRSVGKGERAKIGGKTSQDLQEIESSAYRTVQELRGTAEAEAIRIYADAIGQDTEFYELIRRLDAYKKGLGSDTNLLISSDSDFLRLMRDGVAKHSGGAAGR